MGFLLIIYTISLREVIWFPYDEEGRMRAKFLELGQIDVADVIHVQYEGEACGMS